MGRIYPKNLKLILTFLLPQVLPVLKISTDVNLTFANTKKIIPVSTQDGNSRNTFQNGMGQINPL